MEDKEELLWERVTQKDNERPGETIRIVPIANNIGIHEERARDFSRKWKNDGYVDFAQAGYIRLTEKGREAELPKRD